MLSYDVFKRHCRKFIKEKTQTVESGRIIRNIVDEAYTARFVKFAPTHIVRSGGPWDQRTTSYALRKGSINRMKIRVQKGRPSYAQLRRQ